MVEGLASLEIKKSSSLMVETGKLGIQLPWRAEGQMVTISLPKTADEDNFFSRRDTKLKLSAKNISMFSPRFLCQKFL